MSRVFRPTPATRATVAAIRLLASDGFFRGKVGIDWGTGSGRLALEVLKAGGARRCIGLDIEPENVAFAAQSAAGAGYSTAEASFYEADGFAPRTATGARELVCPYGIL